MAKPPPSSSKEIAAVFAALSQETRLGAYRLLLRYQPFGLAAGDISRLLSVPHNTLSTHLRALEASGLVRSRKDGRSVIFVAEPGRLEDATAFLSIAPGGPTVKAKQPALNYPSKRPADEHPDRIYNVLVLCSGNSARSLIAEAIIAREGSGRFRAFSAGNQPRRRPHPLAIELLTGLGYDTRPLKPKSWATFAEPGAPEMDFVITVCDRAADETSPSWPGHPLVAHWGIPSVAELAASQDENRAAFEETYRNLMNRFTAFINIPFERLALNDLKAHIRQIGSMEGATEKALLEAET